jgi:hypothetical protein
VINVDDSGFIYIGGWSNDQDMFMTSNTGNGNGGFVYPGSTAGESGTFLYAKTHWGLTWQVKQKLQNAYNGVPKAGIGISTNFFMEAKWTQPKKFNNNHGVNFMNSRTANTEFYFNNVAY